MKKIVLLLALVAVGLYSCNKESLTKKNNVGNSKSLARSTSCDIGEIHNQVMEFSNTYSFFIDSSSPDEFINSVSLSTENYISQTCFGDVSSDIREDCKHLILVDSLNARLNQAHQPYEIMVSDGFINIQEEQEIIQLMSFCKSNIAGQITNQEFYDELKNMLEQTNGGEVITPLLSLSKASCEYWVRDENLEPNSVAPWVALDAAGAIVGGGLSYVRGGNVLEGALYGAASGSLRLVGRVARIISSIF